MQRRHKRPGSSLPVKLPGDGRHRNAAPSFAFDMSISTFFVAEQNLLHAR
jgi:hypothetical protein